MRILVAIIIMVLLPSYTFSSGKKRNDPNYSEEFNQVYDAELTGVIRINCEIEQDLKANTMLIPIILLILKATSDLNFRSIHLLMCHNMQTNFQQNIGSLLSTILIQNVSEISTIEHDLLIFVDSSLSRDSSQAIHFGSTSGVNSSGSNNRRKLGIYLDLNFQTIDGLIHESALMYDIVMLLSKAEGYDYKQSWSLMHSCFGQTLPTPEIFIAEASATAWQIQLHQPTKLHGRESKFDHLHYLNKTISIFIPDITSSIFNATSEAEYFSRAIGMLHTIFVRNTRLDGLRIGDINILWNAHSSNSEIDKVKVAFNCLKSAIHSAFDTIYLGNHSGINFFFYNPMELFYANRTKGNDELNYSDALRNSSILWVRLPALRVLSPDFIFPEVLNFNSSSNRSKSTKINIRSNCEFDESMNGSKEWASLHTIEDLLLEAKLFGCLSFLDVSMNLNPHRVSLGRNYNWLVDNINSHVVQNSDELITATVNKIFKLSTKKQHRLRLNAIEKGYKIQSMEAVEEFARVLIDGIMKSTLRNFIQKPKTMFVLRNLTNSLVPSSLISISRSTMETSGDESSPIVPSEEKDDQSLFESLEGKYSAVIVEPRIDFAFEFCVRNVMYHLGSTWDLLVLHSTGPLGNEQFVRRSLFGLPNVTFKAADSVTDGDSYNKLLKSSSFWQNLKDSGVSKIFLFQTDSIMLRHGIDEFMQWDYIGAPWHMQEGAASGAWLQRFQRNGILLEGVGNGGVSLRTVSMMLKISEKYSNKGSNAFNEDTFFAHNCEKLSKDATLDGDGCKLADRKSAYSFAVEIPLAPESVNMTIASFQSQTISNSSDMVGMKLFVPLSLHCTWAYVNPDLFLKLLEMSIAH